MPNLLAHNLVVKRFFLKEDGQNTTSNHNFIRGNFDFLALGSQGPDPLFYVGLLPSHGLHLPTANKRIGNDLHKTDGKKFFKLMIERAYGLENDKDRTRFEAFIFGQLAHYLLDREAHPYILYESGFDENGKISGKYHYDHANFEANIDACLAKKFKMNYFLSNPADALCIDKHFLHIIDKELVPVFKKYYGYEKLPKNLYTNAILNMYSVVKFMNRNADIKKKILPKRITGIAMPQEKPEFPNCLNETKEIWLDPVTGEKHTESFIELHTRSFELLDQCYHEILEKGFNYNVISRYLNGLNYYGTPIGAKWVHKKENEKPPVKA